MAQQDLAMGNTAQQGRRMQQQRIPLANLIASNQPRPLVTQEVDKIARSIKQVGLIQPVVVRRAIVMNGLAQHGFQIVAGHHRVAACRALGWTEIDALVSDVSESLDAELMEIDENLCRADLSAAQRSKYIKRRAQIWEALHPVELEVEQLVPPQVSTHGGSRPQTKAFAASTATATGMTKQSINRHIARAETLGNDLDRVAGTCLDKGVELDALAKKPLPERKDLIQRAVAGEKVSARVAAPSNQKLQALAASIKQALRNVLRDSRGLSVQELGAVVRTEAKNATADEIECLSEVCDYLKEWRTAQRPASSLERAPS